MRTRTRRVGELGLRGDRWLTRPDTGRYPIEPFCADMTTEVIRLLAAPSCKPAAVATSARTALTAMRRSFASSSVPRRRRGWSSPMDRGSLASSTGSLPRTVSRPSREDAVDAGVAGGRGLPASLRLRRGHRRGPGVSRPNPTSTSGRSASIRRPRAASRSAHDAGVLSDPRSNRIAGYLETDRPENVRFYRQFGFDTIREIRSRDPELPHAPGSRA